MSTTTTTFRQRQSDLEPTILVGWVSDLVRVWPEETDEQIVAGAPRRSHHGEDRTQRIAY